MAEHDQRLKTLLKEFLADLLALLFPQWIGRFLFSANPWLEQEVLVDPPHGERREIDLVARLGVNEPIQAAREVLVHIEVESGDSVADLRGRMPLYHDMLHYKHSLPVLSAAVYLGVALQGQGWDEAVEEVWEERLGNTRWKYLGLPGLDARTYVEGDNVLGVAFSVLMRIEPDQRGWLKARAMQRIATAELTAYRRHLLMEFVEAYMPLEGPSLEQFNHLLLTPDFREAQMLGQTTYDRGIERGEERGRRATVRELLEMRFGALSEIARRRLDEANLVRLQELTREVLTANSLVELGLEEAPGTTNGS